MQVVLGVLLDEEGMPLTYEVYPGNTFEGSTVVEMIKRLKDAGLSMSLKEALWELGKVAAVDIETKKRQIRLRTEIKGVRHDLFRALQVKIPGVVLKAGTQ